MRLISDNSDPEPDEAEEEKENEEEVGLTSLPSDKPNIRSSSSEVSTPTAAGYPSICKTSTANDFADRYGVPPEYGLCAPTSDQRANLTFSKKRKRAFEPEVVEEERTFDGDVPIASFKKSCNSTKPSTTESPSAACGQKMLKTMAESHATQPAKTPMGPTGKTHLEDGSKILSVPSLKDIALEQFARYIQKCVCSFNLQLQGDKEELEKIVAAREQDIKVRDSKIALLEAEVSRLNNVCNDRGNLLKVYTCKLLKTLGFAAFFKDLATSVRSIGWHEAAKLVQKRCSDIPKVALEGLEDPLAASKLDNQFFNMVQDDGFEFPLLDYLLSLEEIPSSSQLKVLDVDEDKTL